VQKTLIEVLLCYIWFFNHYYSDNARRSNSRSASFSNQAHTIRNKRRKNRDYITTL